MPSVLLAALVAVACVTPPELPATPSPTILTPSPPPPPTATGAGPTRAVHDREYLQAAVDAVDAARSRVRLSIYVAYRGASVDRLLRAVAAAHDRGVEVRVLADQAGDGTAAALAWLVDRGVDARFDTAQRVLHSKSLVADDVAIVGSHNLTGAALESNHEGSVLVRDAQVADALAGWFDALWVQPAAWPAPAPSSDGPHQLVVDHGVFPALLACIEQADDQIELLLYALAWDPDYPDSEVDQLLDALEGATARGVDVLATLDASDWIVDNGINTLAAQRLHDAGAAVMHTEGLPTTHAKVLRCDDRLLISDANWSYSGLALSNGTTLLTTDAALRDATRSWIASIRAASSPHEDE